MAIPVPPTETTEWAMNLILNSPANTPNREYVGEESRYQLEGWHFGEFPPYQVWNEYNHRVHNYIQWCHDSIQDLETRLIAAEQTIADQAAINTDFEARLVALEP